MLLSRQSFFTKVKSNQGSVGVATLNAANTGGCIHAGAPLNSARRKTQDMTDFELIDAVNEVFADSFEIPREKLTPEAQIFTDLGLDSLDVVDLVAAIQKRFGVQVRDDERVRSIRSMQDLYNYLILIRGEQNKS